MNEFEKEYAENAIAMIHNITKVTTAIAEMAEIYDDISEIQEHLRAIHYAAVTIQKICRPFMTERACMEGQVLTNSQPDKSGGAEAERNSASHS